MATPLISPSDMGMKYATYREQMTATAAMIPECMTQNMAQPHKKPKTGEKASFRYM